MPSTNSRGAAVRSIVLRGGAFALLLTCAAHAQVQERVNVNLVEVPVNVVDEAGNPLRGLTAANFQLYEDGQPRAVTVFDTVDYAAPAQPSAPAPAAAIPAAMPADSAAARRSFLLLFDLSYSNPKTFDRAQKAARDFIANAVAPGDLVGVATLDADQGVRIVSSFTTDRSLVEEAVSDPRQFVSHDPLRIAGRYAYEVPGSAPKRPGADPELIGGKMKLYLDTTHENEGFERRRVEMQFGFLGQLAMSLRALPGRKQVVLLSEGFDAAAVQGRDVRDTAAEATEMEQITRGAIYRSPSDLRLGSSGAVAALERMTKSFRDADVVLHAIDIQGLRVESDVVSGARLNSNEGLSIVTRATGGMLVQRSNDLKGGFERLLRAQEVVYVLGFQSAASSPGMYHTLGVRVTGVPARSRVFTRAGYFEGGVETAEERALTNAEILLNDLPQEGIRMKASAVAAAGEDGRPRVAVQLELDGGDILREVISSNAGVEIFVYAFDAEGNVRDSLYNGVALELAKVGEQLKAGGVKYYGTLSLPPGRYVIRSLARVAKTSRRGFARVDVTVPDLVTAPLPDTPADAAKWVLVKGSQH